MPRMRVALVVLAASAVAVVGLVGLGTAPEVPAVAEQADVDSLNARITTAGWTNMDHDMSSDAPGYQMPPAMMPGMPDNGDQRLAVAVTVVNTGGETKPLVPGEEFALHTDGGRWAPHSDTFGDLPRLAPHNAVKGILFFDLPPAELSDSPAWIEWTHGDTTNRLTIPMDGVTAPPSHSHNP